MVTLCSLPGEILRQFLQASIVDHGRSQGLISGLAAGQRKPRKRAQDKKDAWAPPKWGKAETSPHKMPFSAIRTK
jgi:hypothetical protein